MTAVLLVVGVVLLAAGAGKLRGRPPVALFRLAGDRLAPVAYRVLGAAELGLGSALLLPPLWWVEQVAAAGLFAGLLGFLWYARRVAPAASCGCLGGGAAARVSWRSFARAAVLLGASLAGLGPAGRTPALGWAALAAVLVVVLVVVLSPELDRFWLLPLRRLRTRLRHPLAATATRFDVPLDSSVQQLQRSDAYRRVATLIRSDVREHWDENEWRLICYTARYEGRDATAVFAVPRLRYEPTAVRVALVPT